RNPQFGKSAWAALSERIRVRGGTKAELMFEAFVAGFKKDYRIERGPGQFPTTVDFALPSIKLAIEVDGSSHHSAERRERDRQRDSFLKSSGWTVLRFTNREVLRSPRSVAERVWTAVAEAAPEEDECPN
ncbi:MAG: endonuclease domain-containing protein, partial [Acidobacteriota bacterium]